MSLTVEQFKSVLPDKMKKGVNQELIDSVNKSLADPDMYETYRDNLLSYAHVMRDGRFKLKDYVNAIKYVSHKLMGASNQQAYIKTFPDKYADFVARGVLAKDIASYITAYNKSKLVNLVFEQTLIPSWVLNQDMYQAALNKQFELMNSAKSEKVQSDAANSLLNHLKPPEVQKLELDIGVKENSTLDVLRKATMELVAQQKLSIQSGVVDAKDVAEYRVIDSREVDE